MRTKRRVDEEAEINMTPMLDIVFIMLIFFIVTTSFVKEIGIDVNRPSNQPPTKQKESQVILIEIDEASQITVDRRSVDLAAVGANVQKGLAEKPDSSVVVVSDDASEAGILVKVIDQARAGGATKVSLATDGS